MSFLIATIVNPLKRIFYSKNKLQVRNKTIKIEIKFINEANFLLDEFKLLFGLNVLDSLNELV